MYRKIARLPYPALKYRDFNWEWADIDVVPRGTQSVIDVPQGTTDEQRVGNSMRAAYLVVRWTIFKANPEIGPVSDFIRFCIVRDNRQIADGVPAYTAVFANSSWQAHLNLNERNRFTILYDKLLRVDDDGPQSLAGHFTVRLNHNVKYNGPNGTDIAMNGVYCVCTGSASDVETGPTMFVNCRLAFYDN